MKKKNKKRIGVGLVFAITVLVFILFILKKDVVAEISVETNGGVPYKWDYHIENKDIVKFVKSYESENKNKNGMVGAPIKTNYVFKGLKEGETYIYFEYKNIVDKLVYKTKKYKATVDRDTNIKIEKVN